MIPLLSFLFFFFSSRRRHTRWPRDWSSDVCSSDLFASLIVGVGDNHKSLASRFGCQLFRARHPDGVVESRSAQAAGAGFWRQRPCVDHAYIRCVDTRAADGPVELGTIIGEL